jgi:hypothetical protein
MGAAVAEAMVVAVVGMRAELGVMAGIKASFTAATMGSNAGV